MNGERGLIKGNRGNLSSESMNEVIASKLHEMQELELISAYDVVCSGKKPYDKELLSSGKDMKEK